MDKKNEDKSEKITPPFFLKLILEGSYKKIWVRVKIKSINL